MPMIMFRRVTAVLIAALAATLLADGKGLHSQAVQTDLNLAIAIDCSYSVNADEFRLQVDGIANAFLSPEVIAAIENGSHGQIGIAIFQWSGPDTQEIVIPWTLIASVEDAYGLVDRLLSTPRLTAEGVTAMGSALDFATRLHEGAPFWAERQAIDMQADGTSTWSRGVPIEQARNRAVARGITVNGLPILKEVPYLHHYFENHVIGGPGNFIEIAENYKAFATAIRRKLLREIRGFNLS